MNMGTTAYVIYDANEHGPAAYVTGVQETFLIATLGPRSEARGYSADHADELVRRFRSVGRVMVAERRP